MGGAIVRAPHTPPKVVGGGGSGGGSLIVSYATYAFTVHRLEKTRRVHAKPDRSGSVTSYWPGFSTPGSLIWGWFLLVVVVTEVDVPPTSADAATASRPTKRNGAVCRRKQ